MLYATVLICAASGPCDRIRVPGEFASPVTCGAYAQAYIASTALSIAGRTVTVRCEPDRRQQTTER